LTVVTRVGLRCGTILMLTSFEPMFGRTSREVGVTVFPDNASFEDMVFMSKVLGVALMNGLFLAKVITAWEYEFVDVPVAWVNKLGVSFLERVLLYGVWRKASGGGWIQDFSLSRVKIVLFGPEPSVRG